MACESEVTEFEGEIFIEEHVVRFDIAVNDTVAVKVCDDADHLRCDAATICLREIAFFTVQQIEESAFLHQFHDKTELRRFGDGCNHEYDVRVSVLGEHVHFVVELIKQLFAYVWVEHFLNRHLQIEVPASVDCTKTSH